MKDVSLGRALALAAVPLFVAIGAGSAAAEPASGNPPPPAGFEAQSASFVSAKTGFVLGTRQCSRLPCTARLEKTDDGGVTWSSVRAPAVSLVPRFTTSPASAVSSVRFENATDGWLLAPSLWSTTNGGKHWRKVTAVPGQIIDLAVSDGEVYVSAEPAKGGLNQARLYESRVGGSTWRLVPKVRPLNLLTVFGRSVWAGSPDGVTPGLWTSTDGGRHWSKLPFHCPKIALSASGVAAASRSDVAIACSDEGYPQPGLSVKEVFTSTNGGRTFHLVGKPSQLPEVGQVYGLAMPPGNPRRITLNTASGASYLDQSANGGKTWTTIAYYDGGLGFNDLAYASATTGYVIHFMGSPVIAYSDGLMKTTNAGRTWKSVTIP
ncbi:MAG TPA: hypothetical protein VMA72_05565 [Streptosporangiaceae bacterium]|nr:hypothetical protein [Streptosporangiaceae bacterium]